MSLTARERHSVLMLDRSCLPEVSRVTTFAAPHRSGRDLARPRKLKDEAHVKRIFRKLDIDESPDDHRRALAVLAYLRS